MIEHLLNFTQLSPDVPYFYATPVPGLVVEYGRIGEVYSARVTCPNGVLDVEVCSLEEGREVAVEIVVSLLFMLREATSFALGVES